MSEFLIYQSENGRTKLDVRLEGQTVWLSQKQLTELFGKAKGTISEHIKHIFEDGELDREATVRFYRTVQIEGEREVVREVESYNLDMVLALGFRVRSPMAVRFRQWAADKLKEYIIKGFVLDELKIITWNPTSTAPSCNSNRHQKRLERPPSIHPAARRRRRRNWCHPAARKRSRQRLELKPSRAGGRAESACEFADRSRPPPC